MNFLRKFDDAINIASGLWENCPVSQYYDITSDVWRDCNEIWSFSWSYQKLWFQWPGTQFFDLDTMAWVDSWDSSKVSVNNTQFQGIPICKSLDIYVDPKSTSIISLGTIDNPYKSLLLAFVEILNLHSHSNRTINVYIQTGTTLYVIPDSMYIINVSKVNILTYTSTSSSTVRPKIYSVLSGVTLISPKTLFNIISNTTLNLNPQITNPILTSKEQTDLKTAFVGFMIDRWDFTIDGVDFIANQTQTNKTFTWIKAVYEQSKSVTLRNMNLVIGGNMFDSFDPLNLYLQNLNIDYYKSSRGFYLLTQWNYTNASLLNEISISNISVSNSIDRTRAQINSFLYISGNANFTMSNSSIDLFGSDTESFPQVYFGSSTGWIPSDDIKQYLTIQNTVFTLNQISNNTRYIQIYSNIDSGYSRSVTISLSGLTFKGLTMNTSPVVNFYANTKSMVVLNNLAIINSTFTKDVIDVYNSGSVAINSFTFRNISEFGESMILASSVNNVDINGLTVDSWTLSSTDDYYYFKHVSTSGYTNITGLVFTNTDLKNRVAVYLSSVPSLTIKSSSITGSVIYPANSIIQTGTLSELNIDGFNFTQITSSVSGDNSNYLFSFDSFDLSKSTNFVMNKVMVSQSVLAVLSFSKVVNPSSLSKTFTISNFQYTNSSFSDKNNLITLTKLEQSINFSIMFTNITFSSVSFNVSGNLLNFQQQLSSFTTVSGLAVTNTTNAQIYLQAANKQNTLLPVRVLFTNLTTSNVKSGVNSFIIVNDNTFVNITNSTVQTVTSTGIGATISVSTTSALVNINLSAFSSNSAIEAGAFYVLNSGIIRAYSSTFSNNNASSSGLIKASNGGRFEFYSWTISSNTASEAPIAILFDSSYASILNNWVLSNNTIGLNSGSNTFPIQLISSAILITNSTQITGQYSIISSFVSTITIEDSLLQSSSYNGTAIQIIGSTFSFNNIILNNLSQYRQKGSFNNRNSPSYIIQTSMYSEIIISNVTYSSSSLALLLSQQSTSIISSLSVNNVSSFGFVRLENSVNATLSNWNINSRINNDTWYFHDSYIYLINNITITGIQRSKILLIIV